MEGLQEIRGDHSLGRSSKRRLYPDGVVGTRTETENIQTSSLRKNEFEEEPINTCHTLTHSSAVVCFTKSTITFETIKH